MWRSTTSPTASSRAACSLSPKLSERRFSEPRFSMWFAPGCTRGPLRTQRRSLSRLYRFTRSGYVMIFATCVGTPTWYRRAQVSAGEGRRQEGSGDREKKDGS